MAHAAQKAAKLVRENLVSGELSSVYNYTQEA